MKSAPGPFAFFLPLLVALTLACSFSTDAFAQGRPRPPSSTGPAVVPSKVAVKLLVVAATDSHDRVDPRLTGLTSHLNFLRYKGFDLLDTHEADITAGGKTTFSIVGDRRVEVALLAQTRERAQFRIQISSESGKLLDSTLSVNRNGTFIVAGPRHKDGILILPLQARY